MSIKLGNHIVLKDMSFTIRQGEAWALTGPSGSGKSVLCDAILHRRNPYKGSLHFHFPPDTKMKYVSQQHLFKHHNRLFYQARFNSNEVENAPLVEEVLIKGLTADQKSSEQVMAVLKLLKIEYIHRSRVSMLSNGEHKRLQIAQALLQQPGILILDNPFTGLDTESRKTLHEVINHLIAEGTLVLLITSANEIPSGITHVMTLENGHIKHISDRKSFQKKQTARDIAATARLSELRSIASSEAGFSVAIKMHKVSVKYGNRTILNNIDWEVRKGEKWALSGHNGAGKSTLLSLITGDNPQAYANDIWLFDRKRGSGESIWDIKKQIGYVSPELHVYFRRTMSCYEAISSGFADRMVSGKNITPGQHQRISEWMRHLNIEHLQEIPVGNLSTGEQRLVLLARALVKNPAVLILDEPCQGLDDDQKANYMAILETICQDEEKTLIYVSHYVEEIPSCVSKVLRLKEGSIVG